MTDGAGPPGDSAVHERQTGRCAPGTAHEINNRLGAILSYAELLRAEEVLSGEALRQLNALIEATEQAATFTDALQFAGSVPAQDAEADAASILEKALALKAYPLRKARIRLEVDRVATAAPRVASGHAFVHLLLVLMDGTMGMLPPGAYRIRIDERRMVFPVELTDWPASVADETQRAYCRAVLAFLGAHVTSEGGALAITFPA
jgi:hypothetical protein